MQLYHTLLSSLLSLTRKVFYLIRQDKTSYLLQKWFATFDPLLFHLNFKFRLSNCTKNILLGFWLDKYIKSKHRSGRNDTFYSTVLQAMNMAFSSFKSPLGSLWNFLTLVTQIFLICWIYHLYLIISIDFRNTVKMMFSNLIAHKQKCSFIVKQW